MRMPRRLGLAIPAMIIMAAAPLVAAHSPDRYNVTFPIPVADAHGSMPLGNGEVALNAWVEPGGDLQFYIARTDTWSGNARLLKLGLVRVHLDPIPDTAHFTQTLSLHDATMNVDMGDPGNKVHLQLWVDANHPVIHVDVQSDQPTTATASIELWRTKPEQLPGLEVSDIYFGRPQAEIVEPDVVMHNVAADRIGWYHHNAQSLLHVSTEQQGLEHYERPDPLLNRTFGAIITADHAHRVDDEHLATDSSKSQHLRVYAQTLWPSTPQQWTDAVNKTIASNESTPPDKLRAAHEQWWSDFWDRSWIDITPATGGAAGAPPRVIPANDHPLHAGVDATGHNRWPGEIGRVSVFDRALTDQQIAACAKAGHDAALPASPTVPAAKYSAHPAIGDVLKGVGNDDLAGGVTLEAWVKSTGRDGRIIDKVTPGVDNGILLDEQPGRTLRVIAGPNTLTAPGVIPQNEWVHVATVVTPGKSVSLYVNGRRVAQQRIGAGSESDQTMTVSRGAGRIRSSSTGRCSPCRGRASRAMRTIAAGGPAIGGRTRGCRITP